MFLHIFSTNFTIKLFFLHNYTVHVNEQKENKTKLSHIQIEHTFYCLI